MTDKIPKKKKSALEKAAARYWRKLSPEQKAWVEAERERVKKWEEEYMQEVRANDAAVREAVSPWAENKKAGQTVKPDPLPQKERLTAAYNAPAAKASLPLERVVSCELAEKCRRADAESAEKFDLYDRHVCSSTIAPADTNEQAIWRFYRWDVGY